MPQDRLPSTRSAGPESPAPASPALPPEPLTPDGKDRRVGVEIEYAGVPVAEVAGLVQRIFGGTVVVEDGHRRIIRDTDLGDFTVELDWRLAHGAPALAPPLALPLDRVPDALRERVGDVGSLVMPFEIVCPPIPLARIGELDRLVDHLRRRGGKGTEARFFYAFGLHFNVEVGRRDVTALLHLLRAYLLLSPWLRDQLGVALARRVAPFVHRFPDGYADLVLAPGYAPDLTGLILDYISWNPGRNRELDLYPLFVFLAPEVMTGVVGDPLVKPRPTWHWRLPDSRVGAPGWSILPAWERWVEVERLASDPWALTELSALWRERWRADALEDWPRIVQRWLAP